MGWLSEVNYCEWVKALSSIIAAIIAVCGVKKTIEGNEKAKRIDVITQNRVKWMQEFKDYISRYIALCKYILDSGICKEEYKKYELDIMELYNKLVMHLNFRGEKDGEILDIMQLINTNIFRIKIHNEINEGEDISDHFHRGVYELNKYDLIKDRISLLSLLTQIYLKAEWERIKEEAIDGNRDFDEIYKSIIDENKTKTRISNLNTKIEKTIKNIKSVEAKIGSINKEKAMKSMNEEYKKNS